VITSKDNAKLTLVRKLQQRKHREETGLFVCEGEDLVAAGIDAGLEPVELLVADENILPAVLATASTLPHPARTIGVFRAAQLPQQPRAICLALWRVVDPGNVGTLLRTADAFDASLALSDGCADPLSPRALRASAGAIFRVPRVTWESCPDPRIALVAHGGDPICELKLEPPLTLLLGSEREGLPPELLAGSDAATIELSGAAESLNVAAAGAIALYEVARRAAG
jgi:RNA methyltransferase, TrmH family